MKNDWYKITAKKDDRAEILIYEQIGQSWWDEGVSAKQFVTDLNKLDVKNIDLFINSPGGNVFEGNSIYNALVRHKAEIRVTIDGVAASIASVIAMAGKEIIMPENALLMIHDPSALVMGTASDMEKMIEALDRIKTGLISAYSTHATIDEDAISDMMILETWMTAQEAYEMGFATEIVEPVKMAASFEAFGYFKNVPETLMTDGPKFIKTDVVKTKNSKEDNMEITLDLIQSEHPEIVAEILKAVDIGYIRNNLPDVVDELTADATELGQRSERKRIQAVKEQALPGHEKLIEELMFDGKTTGEQAAVKVLQAVKAKKASMLKDLQTDAPDAIEQPANDNVDTSNLDSLPLEAKCKAKWDKSKDLQNEFLGDFDAYLAYEEAIAGGKAKVLG